MTSVRFALLASALAFAFVACSDEGDSPTDNGCTEFPCQETYFDLDYETNPDYALVVDDCRSSSPHGPRITVHISPATASAFYLDREGRDAGFAEGTILVKATYNTPDCAGTPIEINVMRKGPAGTAPGSGDWEWEVVNYQNESVQSGQIGTCISCHSMATQGCGSDYDYTCIDPAG